VAEQFSEQVARRSVHGAEGNESKGQQRRGNNTTHRGELQGLGFLVSLVRGETKPRKVSHHLADHQFDIANSHRNLNPHGFHRERCVA